MKRRPPLRLTGRCHGSHLFKMIHRLNFGEIEQYKWYICNNKC